MLVSMKPCCERLELCADLLLWSLGLQLAGVLLFRLLPSLPRWRTRQCRAVAVHPTVVLPTAPTVAPYAGMVGQVPPVLADSGGEPVIRRDTDALRELRLQRRMPFIAPHAVAMADSLVAPEAPSGLSLVQRQAKGDRAFTRLLEAFLPYPRTVGIADR